MTCFTFERLAPVLNSVGMAEARDEPIDLDELASEISECRTRVEELLGYLDRCGLAFPGDENDPETPAMLMDAGSQYLALGGEVAGDVLFFLPKVIDDLHGRKALLDGGTLLVDEFLEQLAHGNAVPHAATLVPTAFADAVDEPLAVNLFAAAVALVARLSCGRPAGCVAEEIMAVAMLNYAEVCLDVEAAQQGLDDHQGEAARRALHGIFSLFDDNDVLALFRLKDPSDAADTWANQQAGIVDQRLEAWFQPFGGVARTGYLEDRDH